MPPPSSRSTPDSSRPRSDPARRREGLRGRGRERASLAAVLAEPGGALVVQGPPGIGRSALIDAVLGELGEGGPRAVRLAPAGHESGWGLSTVGDLVVALREHLHALPPPLADALARIGTEDPPPPLAVALAVTALAAEAGAERGLAVVVDDAQELDPDSATVLGSMGRRLAEEPVVLVLAVAGPPVAALADLPSLVLGPLGDDEAATVVADHAVGITSAAVVARLVEAAEGVPLALVELTRALTVEQLAGRAPLAEPLPVGPLLEKVALEPLAELDPETVDALVVVAVGDGLPAAVVARALSGLGADLGALEPAEDAGLVQVAAGRISVDRPVVRSALVQAAGAPRLRRAHRLVAAALAPDDPRRAVHRAAAAIGPDARLAVELVTAAEVLRRRGAPLAAAAALERAAELSETDLDAARRRLAAARAYLVAGLPGPVARLLEAVDHGVVVAEGGPALRAELDRLRSAVLADAGRIDDAVGLALESAARRADAPDAAVDVLLDAFPLCLRQARPGLARTVATRAAEALGPRASDETRARVALAGIAAGALRGDRSATGDLEAVIEVLEQGRQVPDPFLVECAGLALVWSERYERARVLLGGWEQAARAGGAPGPLAVARTVQAFAGLRTARLAEAAVAAAEGARLAEEAERTAQRSLALAVLAVVEAMRGDADGCRAAAEQLLSGVLLGDDARWELPARAALGLLALGEGRPEDAVAELSPLLRSPARPWLVMWEPDLAEALIRTGRVTEASAVVDRLARAGEAGAARATASATRLRGLLATDVGEAEVHLRTAIERYGELGAPFGVARSQLNLGAALRRARQRAAARRALEDARRTFRLIGADVWVGAAEVELRAAGARVEGAPPVTLTPQELQVATLVAAGSSNREVAEALFISVRTVESHLGRIYRKVGVRSRSELAARVAEEGWLAP